MLTIFTDLDDTLFSAKHTADRLVGATQATDSPTGRISYMTQNEQKLLNWMQAGNAVIPVTARAHDAFARVRLPFAQGAILSNGAVILTADGTPDTKWAAYTRYCATAAKPALLAIAKAFQADADISCALHWHDDVCQGVTLKSRDRSPSSIQNMMETVAEQTKDWDLEASLWTHKNSNFIAFVPQGISKKDAVKRFLQTHPDLATRPSVGVGDSTSDLGFMSLCDMMLIPQRSQISDALRHA